MLKIISKIALIILICTLSVQADGISVEASLDRNNGYIGDRIDFELTVNADSAFAIDSIDPQPYLENYILKDWRMTRNTGNRDGQKIVYEGAVTTYETGKIVFPPIGVSFSTPDGSRDSIFTDSIDVFIMSLVLDDSAADIKALKDVKSLGKSYAWLYYLIGTVVVIGAFILWLILRKRPEERMISSEPLKSPWEEARERLEILKHGNPEPKPFYIELSEIIRGYLQRRYGFSALDMTTFEIKNQIEKLNFDLELRKMINGILTNADFVKFAKMRPGREAIDNDLEEAFRLVDITSPGNESETTGRETEEVST